MLIHAMVSFAFAPASIPAGIEAFRVEIRRFLAVELAADRNTAQRVNSWTVFDPEFTRKMGARGWLGMVWPKRYGGHERSSVERYVLLEEMLAAGAPVGAHWVADRQSGPTLLRFGTEQQRIRYLPAMARGELYCCIGMSEPNAGSDLAAVRSRADKVDGGWRINGQKIWTTLAQHCHLMIALVRTDPVNEKARHRGLTQFLIDLAIPGIAIRPIVDLVGDSHFNEVFFQDVFVSDDAVLGEPGCGWAQVTSELSLERSGPERFLSSFALLQEMVRLAETLPDDILRQAIGRLTAELWTLRQMSLSVAAQLALGADASVGAAMVKDLGNSFEQLLPALAQSLAPTDLTLEGRSDFIRLLAVLLQVAPSFSLRGGTREILRGIIARGLGLR